MYSGFTSQSKILCAPLADLFLLVLFNCLLFAVPLGEIIPLASYLEEACSVLILILGIFVSKGRVLNNWERCASVLYFILVIIGCCGNVAYGIQQEPVAIAMDIIASTKFFIALIGGYLYFSAKDTRLIFELVEAEAKILSIIFFTLATLNLFIDTPMRSTGRYDIPAFQGLWPHPSYLVISLVALVSVLSVNWKKNRIFLLLAILVIASSLRSKAFAIAGVYICLSILLNQSGRVGISQIALIAICAICIGWSAFELYYGASASGGGYARFELQETSFRIADEYFPLGAGFGTYGSNASGRYYSPLYYQYGLVNVWGLQPDNYSFLSDTFWPTVIGQFGWIGLMVYALIVSCVFLGARCRIVSKGHALAIIICIAYLLISSTSESSFFNPGAPLLAVCIAAFGSSEEFPTKRNVRQHC